MLNGALVRTLLDYFGSIPDSNESQIKVLKDNIDWAKREKRIFLKHNLETRLIGMCVRSPLPPKDERTDGEVQSAGICAVQTRTHPD